MAQENGHDGGEGNQNIVFIDTSLETHLATIVSDSDTVSDLKRKMVLEHRQCFPAIGDIKVNSLKVKRRGIYYHLSDSMLVRSAFQASKKNWFLSVDASHLEQCDVIQHNPGDQLALPWIKDGCSTKSDDSQADRPSKPSLIHGSPSKHLKIVVPFVNQKVPSVDQFTSDDSWKKVSKNIEDRSSHDDFHRNLEPDIEQQLDLNVSKEIKSKKRTRDVQNEDASVKKRHKAQRTEGNVKALEEDRLLKNDADKVKDMGTSIHDENSIEDKSKSNEAAVDGVVVVTKAMNDEDTRTALVRQKKPKRSKKGKISAQEQAATVVPLILDDIVEEICKNTEASEVTPNVGVVVEKNIQQEMPFHLSQKDKCYELDQEADIGNEITSSSMKGVTAEDELVVKDADDLVVNISSSVPTAVFDEQIIDEEKKDNAGMIIDEEKKDNTKMISDEKNEGDDVIVKEVKIAKPSESHRTRAHKGKPKKERNKKKVDGKSLKEEEIMKQSDNDAATGTKKENLVPSSERKESVEITSIDAFDLNNGRNDDIMVDIDAEISRTEKKESELNAECVNSNAEKQNEKMDDIKKSKKKRKTKKSVARNEGDNGDLLEKIADVSQVDADKLKSKDAQIFDEGLVKKSKKNRISSTRTHSDMPSKLESEPERSKIPEEPSKNMTEFQVSNGDNEGNNGSLQEKIADVSKVDVDKLKSKDAQILDNGLVKKPKRNRKSSTRAQFDISTKLEAEPEKSKIPEEPLKNMTEFQVSNGDNEGNDGNLQEKIADVSQVDVDKLKLKDAQILDNGLVKKSKKNRKSSKRANSDMSSKIPEEPLKNMAESQLSKGDNVNHEVDISKEGSNEIDFMTYFSPSQQEHKIGLPDKLNKTSKEQDSKNDDAIQSSSRNENKKESLSSKKLPEVSTNGVVVKDQNAPPNKVKTQKTTTKIDAPKTRKPAHAQKNSKQPPTLHPNNVKDLKKSAPVVKSLLNRPVSIFGDSSDDSSADDNAAIDSDSSTRTPSSSSGDSDYSIDSRRYGFEAVKRKQGDEKNNMNSQSRLKNISMSDLLRSSSRFKKAIVTASKVMDTESEPVDFVPESQPLF